MQNEECGLGLGLTLCTLDDVLITVTSCLDLMGPTVMPSTHKKCLKKKGFYSAKKVTITKLLCP